MPLSLSWRAFAASASSTLRRASALAPVGCGGGQPGTGPLDHGVAFQLRERGHDGEHRFRHRALGMQALGYAPEPDSARCQLIDNSKNVFSVGPQTVKLPDREDVTFAEVIETAIETWSL